jgi:hypothetical protein
MDDNQPSLRWFKAPASLVVADNEVTCCYCRLLIREGEIIADDGLEFVHQDCFEANLEEKL